MGSLRTLYDQPCADYRLPVLLILAALIAAACGWHAAEPARQSSSYFWSTASQLLRIGRDKSEPHAVPLSARLSCAATPPEVARFFGLPLPISRVDHVTLTDLPSIGPKLAERILAFRAEQGGIAGPDDLIKVKGIGPKRLALLLPLLCFDPAP